MNRCRFIKTFEIFKFYLFYSITNYHNLCIQNQETIVNRNHVVCEDYCNSQRRINWSSM